MGYIIHEPHVCTDDLAHHLKKYGAYPRRTVWECECGNRFTKGAWFGWWRRRRWFDSEVREQS